MQMNRAIVVFILVFFTAVQVNALTIENTNLAIHNSGKTRMLAMKMANLYGVQVLKNFPIGKKRLAQGDLSRAKKTMNEIYKALLAFEPVATDTELVEIVKAAQSSWIELGKLLSRPPSKTGFLDILDASDILLDENEMMTSYMESLSPVPISEIINMAVRQQMYAMKLSRDYLAASMDLDKEYRIDLMLDAAVEFESAMLFMEGASENTVEIKGLIKSITKMEWRKVYKTVTECIESNGTTFNVFMMMGLCDTLLEKVKRLTNIHVMSENTSYGEAITTTKDRIDDEAITTTKDRIDDEAITTTKDGIDDEATTTTKDRIDDEATTTTKDGSNFPFSNRRYKDRSDDEATTTTKDRSNFPFSNRRYKDRSDDEATTTTKDRSNNFFSNRR